MRLIRALLADPLVPEQPWEVELVDAAAEDGRALLIRYVVSMREQCKHLADDF